LRLIAALGAVLVGAGGGAAHASPVPGDFDRSFGENGFVEVTEDAPPLSGAFDMAVGPNGSIYLLASTKRCSTPSRCVQELTATRFKSDGSLDAAYGAGGTATAFPEASLDAVPEIEVDSQGRAIVVARDGGDVVVTRLDRSGSPDAAFGGTRRLTTGAKSEDMLLGLVVTGDDEAVISVTWSDPATATAPESTVEVLLARFLADGSLDPDFGASGVLRTSIPEAQISDLLAVGRDGTAILALQSCCGVLREPILLQVPAGGSPEPDFGMRIWGDSLADRLDASEINPHSISVMAVFVRRNGRLDILVSALGRSRRPDLSYLIRVRPDGRLDRRFGRNGIRSLPKPVQAAAVDSEGRIFVVSRKEEFGLPVATEVYRLTAGGRLDRTFGGGVVDVGRLENPSGVQVAAFAGQRPVLFDQRAGECRTGCFPEPVLARFRGGGSSIQCLGRPATIVGTRRGETLTGTRRRDVIAALGGADAVRGMRGDDVICGGRGRDTIIDSPGRDQVRP
jgi:uncharacterized delta-60 repeat protein